MNEVFANRTARRDFVINEIERCTQQDGEVFIASAFFTEVDVVQRMLDKGCRVSLVVRLGFPTSPDAIERVLSHPNAKLRVYTGRSFHPKLYLFDADVALVGSANLTHQAVTSNQEVMVAIPSHDPRFSELTVIFEEYWQDAEVPTAELLKQYREIYKRFLVHASANQELDREWVTKVGDKSPANINRGQPRANAQSVFLSTFRRTYQEAVGAFEILKRVYAASGYRKAPEVVIPLRLEIDSFISYIRERHAVGDDAWQQAPVRTPTEQEPIIRGLIEQWRQIPWPHFDDVIVQDRYPRLQRVFATAETVRAATDDDLFDALCTCHSFHDRLRFFDGGLETWRREFAASNDPVRVRDSLAYLVFGHGDIVERMANVVFDKRWKLAEFGKANVQELIGWRNSEDLPVINGRTTKVLRWLGSRVRQL